MIDIIAVVKTKDASVAMLKKLDLAIAKSYSSKFSRNSLKGLPVTFSKKSNMNEVLLAAKDSLVSAQLLNITVAVDLEDSFIDKLYDWFTKNGFKDFLLDITKDTSIYGGLLLSFNGKYMDLSLKKRASEYVQQKSKL